MHGTQGSSVGEDDQQFSTVYVVHVGKIYSTLMWTYLTD